ncbi:FAD-binding domain-containing protein [Aspergillus pseudodeflectus]|uniref:FAD-binding domain-containing protein n=1 Tax=Aspergillus pseudodeflectus TaxID=176178 RepID=A0ABR4JRY4_9EURO
MALLSLALVAVLGQVTALSPRMSSLSSVSDTAWQSLNSSVGGRLYYGEPLLAPCYTRYNGHFQRPDAQECSILQRNRTNGPFVSDHFGGYQNVNWAACQSSGESCAFGSLSPDLVTPVTKECKQGSVSPKYVDARSVEDVQKTLLFAQENNLPVVIKNTGHDYTGRSSGPDSLGLWTHHIQPPITLQKGFIPQGCSDSVGDVITFGAGQQFAGIYKFAHEHNYRVVGGSSSTVGAAGGWITGGGHSLLSNELGLGVDNVQQLKAVLPNGTYITANRCQNQDIFFALRGGGGGTFGVITEMSTLAHPEKPMVSISVFSYSPNSAKDFISIIVANADRWASEGWGGYIQPGLIGKGVSSFFMATSLLNQTAAEISMKPMTDFAHHQGTLAIANITSTSTYFEIMNALVGTGAAESLGSGGATAMSSRIIPQKYFRGPTNQQKLSSILLDILTAAQADSGLLPAVAPLFICVTAPTIYSRSLPESDLPNGPGASSVTPAWRTGLWHAIHLRSFSPSKTRDPDTVREMFQAAHDTMNPLREFTPDGGAYQNEADAFETDPIGSFWGEENYARLLRIKREVDPKNLLSVHNGVGWEREDGRFRCYPDVTV